MTFYNRLRGYLNSVLWSSKVKHLPLIWYLVNNLCVMIWLKVIIRDKFLPIVWYKTKVCRSFESHFSWLWLQIHYKCWCFYSTMLIIARWNVASGKLIGTLYVLCSYINSYVVYSWFFPPKLCFAVSVKFHLLSYEALTQTHISNTTLALTWLII